MAAPFSGVVLLDKRVGDTSFGALASLKRRFSTRKIGHTGTLDPMATGLLVALVGSATRCARFFSSLEKVYEAQITFGAETDTCDQTGAVTGKTSVPDMEYACRIAQGFVGEISQVPPVYSAVHVNGRRAYELARSGESVELATRTVTIGELSCRIVNASTLAMTVRCSSGTYIRSLARDIGRAANSMAHLSALRRTRVGPFRVDEATSGVAPGLAQLSTIDALLRLGTITGLHVDDRTAAVMSDGGKVPAPETVPTDGSEIVLAYRRDEPVALGRWQGGVFRYVVVFPRKEAAE